MFGELTFVNCLARKSLANGCQPNKNYCVECCFVFIRYDKIINLCVLSCFYAVGVSNDELSEQQYLASYCCLFINLWLPYICMDLGHFADLSSSP